MNGSETAKIKQSWKLEAQVKDSLSEISLKELGVAILIHQGAWAVGLTLMFTALALSERGSWLFISTVGLIAILTIPAARNELSKRKLLPEGALRMEKKSQILTGFLGLTFIAAAIYVLILRHDFTEAIGLWGLPLGLIAILCLVPRAIFGLSLTKSS